MGVVAHEPPWSVGGPARGVAAAAAGTAVAILLAAEDLDPDPGGQPPAKHPTLHNPHPRHAGFGYSTKLMATNLVTSLLVADSVTRIRSARRTRLGPRSISLRSPAAIHRPLGQSAPTAAVRTQNPKTKIKRTRRTRRATSDRRVVGALPLPAC